MIQLTKENLLEAIKQYLPDNPIIIEAGAFNGCDTIRLAKQWPEGTIYSFEPVPELFQLLLDNTKKLKNVKCFQLGLSNKTGTARFYVSEKPEQPGKPFRAGSLHKPKERLAWSPVIYPKTTTINTITLEDWAQQHDITHVDFLWLDIQGHELNVIKASPNIVKTVKILYVEVQFVQAYEQQYTYQEVKNWLNAHDFELIGRDFPDKPTWFFGNALFVKK